MPEKSTFRYSPNLEEGHLHFDRVYTKTAHEPKRPTQRAKTAHSQI